MIWKTSQKLQINTRSSHLEVEAVIPSKDVLKDFAKFTDKHLCPSLFFNKVAGWKAETVRSSYWRCSVKKVFLKGVLVFQNQSRIIGPLHNWCSWITDKFTGKNLSWSLFLRKLQFWRPAILLKKTPKLILSCEICKLYKQLFWKHLWMSASKRCLKRDSNTGVFPWILWIIEKHLFFRGSANGWFWNTSAGVSL